MRCYWPSPFLASTEAESWQRPVRLRYPHIMSRNDDFNKRMYGHRSRIGTAVSPGLLRISGRKLHERGQWAAQVRAHGLHYYHSSTKYRSSRVTTVTDWYDTMYSIHYRTRATFWPHLCNCIALTSAQGETPHRQGKQMWQCTMKEYYKTSWNLTP